MSSCRAFFYSIAQTSHGTPTAAAAAKLLCTLDRWSGNKGNPSHKLPAANRLCRQPRSTDGRAIKATLRTNQARPAIRGSGSG